MGEKAVKTGKSKSGCGICFLVLTVLVIGFGVLGYVFRTEIKEEYNKLRSNSSDSDFDGYTEVSTKFEETTEDLVLLTSTRVGLILASDSSPEEDGDNEVTPQLLPSTTIETPTSSTMKPEHDRSDDQNSTVATERMTTTSEATTTSESVTTTTSAATDILHEGSGSGAGKLKSTLSDDEDYVEGST